MAVSLTKGEMNMMIKKIEESRKEVSTQECLDGIIDMVKDQVFGEYCKQKGITEDDMRKELLDTWPDDKMNSILVVNEKITSRKKNYTFDILGYVEKKKNGDLWMVGKIDFRMKI